MFIWEIRDENTDNIENPGKSGPTGGSFTFSFDEKDGKVTFTATNLFCHNFFEITIFDETTIDFNCRAPELGVANSVNISRLSGGFRQLFTVDGGKGGLLHTGTCRKAEKKF